MRPTSDKVREALFQILTIRMERPWASCRVLDLFAGTGALGLEALSRGAMDVVFVDYHHESLGLIKKNLAATGFMDRAVVAGIDILKHKRKFLKLVENQLFDLVLADPPYSRGMAASALELINESCCVRDGGWMVLEERKGVDLNRDGLSLDLEFSRCYGQTCVWFFTKTR